MNAHTHAYNFILRKHARVYCALLPLTDPRVCTPTNIHKNTHAYARAALLPLTDPRVCTYTCIHFLTHAHVYYTLLLLTDPHVCTHTTVQMHMRVAPCCMYARTHAYMCIRTHTHTRIDSSERVMSSCHTYEEA